MPSSSDDALTVILGLTAIHLPFAILGFIVLRAMLCRRGGADT
ncbi:hypothetical protein ACUSIJ_17820 [Pseudochelatococcus sp. B33]